MSAMFRSLAGRDYRVWFVGALVSNIGAWMQATAQNWVVLTELTANDALAVGITMALQFAPQLLLVPITGLIADRFERRKILMVTQTCLMLLGLALGLLLILGHAQLWHLYGFALALGIVNAVDTPARQTFVADLVSGSNMSNAVALNSASFNAARMIGPAVAGLVIAAIGTGWAFLLNGASFVAVLISLACLRTAELRSNARAHRARGSFTEGFRYVWGRPDLRAILVMLFVIGTFGLNFSIFISTMAVSVFHTDAQGYGLLSSCMAIGTVAGALLNASREKPRFQLLLIGAAVFGLGCTLAAIAPGYWFFAAALVVTGMAAITVTNTSNSLMQLTTEPAMRGRVMALRVAIALGGTPIGAPIVGWVAGEYGPRWALGIGAAAGFAAALVAVYVLARRR